MSVEFSCEGCGCRVFDVARNAVPVSHMCCVCDWLCEFIADPIAMQEIRERTGEPREAREEFRKLIRKTPVPQA
jgi:hypothetical protein